MVRLELATLRLQTERSSHGANKLKSYCWEGAEFIQWVYYQAPQPVQSFGEGLKMGISHLRVFF